MMSGFQSPTQHRMNDLASASMSSSSPLSPSLQGVGMSEEAASSTLSCPPLSPSPPKTVLEVPTVVASLPSSSLPAFSTAPLLTDLHAAQTTLISSLCQQVTEATMTHYSNTLHSVTAMYEDRLLTQQQHYEGIITQLQQQIQQLQGQSQRQNYDHQHLQQHFLQRTDKFVTFLQHRYVAYYQKPTFNIQHIFQAWKQSTRRSKRCVKMEERVLRMDRKQCLQKYFLALQRHLEDIRQEKYIAEMKFKYETLSNEVKNHSYHH